MISITLLEIMKRRHILKSIPFALSSWASAVYSQTTQSDDIAKRFDMAAAKHKRELSLVYQGW